jgi:hypothetical protein
VIKRTLMAVALILPVLFLSGCDDDQRSREEKEEAPKPELSTRYVMQCPKCGASQRPYRLTHTKSYYKCEGKPPKFPYHEKKEWSHRIKDQKDVESTER